MELYPAEIIDDSEYYDGMDNACDIRRLITGCHAVLAFHDWEGFRLLSVISSRADWFSLDGDLCRAPFKYMDSAKVVREDYLSVNYPANSIVRPDDPSFDIGYVAEYPMITKWTSRCGRNFGMNAIDLCGHRFGILGPES